VAAEGRVAEWVSKATCDREIWLITADLSQRMRNGSVSLMRTENRHRALERGSPSRRSKELCQPDRQTRRAPLRKE